jgi:hypothetical protein
MNVARRKYLEKQLDVASGCGFEADGGVCLKRRCWKLCNGVGGAEIGDLLRRIPHDPLKTIHRTIRLRIPSQNISQIRGNCEGISPNA